MKLDQIRSDAAAKFAHLPVEFDDGSVLLLRNALQLDEDGRKALSDDEVDSDGNKIDRPAIESFRRQIRVIADNADLAERLIEDFGENLAFYAQLFGEYAKATQVGEA